MLPRMPSFSRTRTAPSGYSKWRTTFHILRTAQLLSSLIVGAIMLYFIYQLTHDHWATPWTFLVLTGVSLLTIAFLAATIIFHCCCGLIAKINLALNALLLVLWGMGFGMLAWYMWGTLTHVCNVANWNDGVGIMVCRIYKALFTFSLLGLYVLLTLLPPKLSVQSFWLCSFAASSAFADITSVSTVGALALDVHIYRTSTRLGSHVRLEDMDTKTRAPAVRGPYTDANDHDADEEAASFEEADEIFPTRHSEAFEVPRRGYGAQPSGKQMQSEGYAMPEGQFDYDTGYHGGHAERVFGSG